MTSFPLRESLPDGLSLEVLARHLGVDPPSHGGELRVRGIAPLDRAQPHELGLLSDPRYLDRLEGSRAGAILLRTGLEPGVEATGRPFLAVPDPHAAMRRILERLYPERGWDGSVHPTAVVDASATLGAGVRIGPFAVVEEDVVLGDRVRVGAHAVVGAGSRVGDDALLHPGVVVYPGVELGSRVILHAGARVGVDGYGYVHEGGEHLRIPHVGGCVLEDDVEVGANSCIDRGSIGETRVGAGTKIDNLVHLGHNVRVGAGGLFVAQAGVSGSTTLGRGVIVGGQAGIGGHLEIGDGARIAGQAGIIGDVPPGETFTGFPARPHREFMRGAASQYKVPGLIRRIRELEARLEALAGSADVPGAEAE
jgi:UDP-3-O-[3-hydroxymyristoyl] glucosamine N-acyltransferase